MQQTLEKTDHGSRLERFDVGMHVLRSVALLFTLAVVYLCELHPGQICGWEAGPAVRSRSRTSLWVELRRRVPGILPREQLAGHPYLQRSPQPAISDVRLRSAGISVLSVLAVVASVAIWAMGPAGTPASSGGRMKRTLGIQAMVARTSSSPRPVLRGVVFDMDGTLTKPNLDFGEMYRRCDVDQSDDILAAIAAKPPGERAAAQAVVDEMESEGRRTLQLMPGAVELARWLQLHGIPMSMVTRNTGRTVDHFHRALWEPAGLPRFAPAIARDAPAELAPKPDPAALRAIAADWVRSEVNNSL